MPYTPWRVQTIEVNVGTLPLTAYDPDSTRCRPRNAPRATLLRRGPRSNGLGRLLLLVLAVGAAWSCMPARGESTSERIAQVDAWLRLRRELAQEREAWNARRRSLEQRIDLLQREKLALQQRLSDGTHAARRDTEEHEALQRGLAAWEDELHRAEDSLTALAHQLDTAPDGEAWRLPQEGALTERLGALFTRALDLQRRHQRLWHETQVLDTPEGRRRMDVLHLGFAQAYAVTPDNRLAGHGVWTGARWRWSWNPDWAPAIRHALHIQQAESPPRWVELPITLPDPPPDAQPGASQ